MTKVAFAAGGAVLASIVALLPPGTSSLATLALVIGGVVGGWLVRSMGDVAGLTLGGAAGALATGALTYGGPFGPHSAAAFVLGVVIVAIVLGVTGAIVHWLLEHARREPGTGTADDDADRDRRARRAIVLAGALGATILATTLVLAASLASREPTAGAGAVTPAPSPAAAAAGATPAVSTADDGECGRVYTHQAPDVEAALPKQVAGRDFIVWSVVGSCWFTVATNDESGKQQLADLAQARGITVDDLRYAIAGRKDTDADPPFFLFGIAKPASAPARELAVTLLLAGASFTSTEPPDPAAYTRTRIGGHDVLAGDASMVRQSEHIRGVPYLVETDGFLFIVVTDDPAWAEAAIAQLPD